MVETILPKSPGTTRAPNSQTADEWKLVLVSTTKQTVIDMLPYAAAMERLKPYIQAERNGQVLTLAELEGLLGE